MASKVVKTNTTKFPMGDLVATPAAMSTFTSDFMQRCLRRHLQGDWGNVDLHDRRANDHGLRDGERLLSVYEQDAKTLWVVTEADRSVTTFLLPSDY